MDYFATKYGEEGEHGSSNVGSAQLSDSGTQIGEPQKHHLIFYGLPAEIASSASSFAWQMAVDVHRGQQSDPFGTELQWAMDLVIP